MSNNVLEIGQSILEIHYVPPLFRFLLMYYIHIISRKKTSRQIKIKHIIQYILQAEITI